MNTEIKKKIPVSSIIVPVIYIVTALSGLFLSKEIYESTYDTVSQFEIEPNIFRIGIFNFIYALLIVKVYRSSFKTYFSLLPIFAFHELVMFLYKIYLFTEFPFPHILYSGVFNFGFFILFMYERKIFK
tara:strand:+ start:429 stop:815 length:387 start_codon:yes stop_codon:yes gene_type:complete